MTAASTTEDGRRAAAEATAFAAKVDEALIFDLPPQSLRLIALTARRLIGLVAGHLELALDEIEGEEPKPPGAPKTRNPPTKEDN
jgi:hypothetical protein